MGRIFKRTPLAIPDNWNAKSRLLVMNIDRMFQELEKAMDQVDESQSVLTAGNCQKNTLYRGKNLGTITADNIDAFVTDHEIAAGKFTDLYLGDSFVIQDGTYNAEWMIAGFDLDYGKKAVSDETKRISHHHIVLIPKGAGLFQARMNATDITTTGFYNSEMNQTTLPAIATVLGAVLGDHMKEMFKVVSASANSSGRPTSFNTDNSVISMLTVRNVFGYVSNDVSDYATSKTTPLLPVYRYIDPGAGLSDNYWLIDIYEDGWFCATGRFGTGISAAVPSTANAYYVRPKIAIG